MCIEQILFSAVTYKKNLRYSVTYITWKGRAPQTDVWVYEKINNCGFESATKFDIEMKLEKWQEHVVVAILRVLHLSPILWRTTREKWDHDLATFAPRAHFVVV